MDSITNIFRSIATNEIDQIFNEKNKLKSLLIQSCSGEILGNAKVKANFSEETKRESEKIYSKNLFVETKW